jgi:hypothetical protein
MTMVSALLLAAGFLACGGEEKGLSDQAVSDLQARVARVRAAAGAGDRAGAGREVAAVRGAVDRYRGQGQISAGRAADVLAAAGEVEARLALLAAPTPTPAPTPAPATTTTTTANRAPIDAGDGTDDENRDKKGGGKKKEDD